MILSGNGSQSEFFSADTATRLYKLPNLCKWYRQMSNDKAVKKMSDQFITELKGQIKFEERQIPSENVTINEPQDTDVMNTS